jgi:hypothetical protein
MKTLALILGLLGFLGLGSMITVGASKGGSSFIPAALEGLQFPAGSSPIPGGQAAIAATFPGDSAIGPKTSPDNVGAAGPNHVVDFTCANFVVHDKATGKVLQQKTQVQFWKDLGFDNVHPNDPRFMFDPLSGRWIATIASDKVHHLFLAVSTKTDPTQPWKGVQTPFDSPDFGFRAGVDKNGYYGCWWNRNSDIHKMMNCCAIPKEDLIAAQGPDLSRVQVFTDLEIEAFPETDLNPDKSGSAPEILLNREFGNSFSKMYLIFTRSPGRERRRPYPRSRASRSAGPM